MHGRPQIVPPVNRAHKDDTQHELPICPQRNNSHINALNSEQEERNAT